MVKIITIINKNIRVVARSWFYVALLVILPTLLVLAASILLDSVDIRNIPIGVVSSSLNYKVEDMIPGSRIINYNTYAECELSLKSHDLPICIKPTQIGDAVLIEIFFDNSQLIISQYAKHYITKKVLEEQVLSFELTLDEVLTKMDLLSIKVDQAQLGLKETHQELIVQEEKIMLYQENFTRTKNNFQESYSKIKYYQSIVNSTAEDLILIKEYLDKNLSELHQRNQQLKTQINYIKPILQTALPSQDYEDTARRLDEITASIDAIESELNQLNAILYYEDPEQLMIEFNNMIKILDETNNLLNAIDIELRQGLILINENKKKIAEMLLEIELSKTDFQSIKEKMQSASDDKVVLKDAFQLGESASNLFFPLIFVLIIAFTSIILSNMFIIEQTHKPSYIREMITPTYDLTFLMGDYFVCLFIILVQIVMLLFIGHSFFELSIINNFGYLMIISALISSIFVLMGISLGYLIRSRHISILSATFALLFFIIFSDLLIPRQLTGFFMRTLTSLNPFVIANKLLFNVMIFSQIPNFSSFYLTFLIILLLGLFLFSYMSKKISKYRVTKE